MPTRTIYHVVPAERGGWNVTKEGAQRASVHTSTKGEAIARARVFARGAGLGQVIVHGEDGRIETEWTYGQDPRETPG